MCDSGRGLVPGGWHDPAVAIMVNRAVLAHRLFTGLSRSHPACLVGELAEPWQARVEGRRHATRGGARKRAAGAGASHQLVFVDRPVVTLIHLRHDLPHSVLGLLFGVDRSSVTRAIGGVGTLLAERGCAVPDRPGLRLRTLTDVFAYAQAEGVERRLGATEIRVRRPPAGRGGRRAPECRPCPRPAQHPSPEALPRAWTATTGAAAPYGSAGPGPWGRPLRCVRRE